MYRDNTLIPTEVLRLCALGLLVQREQRYSALAGEVRRFTSRLVGPSLDMLGPSIELLRFEGLMESAGDEDADDPVLRITDAGRQTFDTLMRAGIRAQNNDLGKLVVAVKMRFMHLLDKATQADQAMLLIEMCENELARLNDLLDGHEDEAGYLRPWLEQDIAHVKARLAWFGDLKARL